ncbi:MAG: hypothetical protein LBM95_08425 [Lactobacillales bacterium]|jgi:hypothetical protein|nr:hypothetical protein [Lactobacillales bacterium]
MKSKKFILNTKLKLSIFIGLFVATGIFIYLGGYHWILDLNKNHYSLESESYKDSEGNQQGFYVKVSVENPTKERITLKSGAAELDYLISPEAQEELVFNEENEKDAFKLTPPKKEGSGIDLEIKTTKKKETIKVPVPYYGKKKFKFELYRDNHTIKKGEYDPKKEEKSLAIVPKKENGFYLENKFVNSSTKNLAVEYSMVPLNSEPSVQLEWLDSDSVVVKDVFELEEAVLNNKIKSIKFGANIDISKNTKFEKILVNHSVEIDGCGYVLNGGSKIELFTLDSDSVSKLNFSLKNMQIITGVAGSGSKQIVSSKSDVLSQKIQVSLENITGRNDGNDYSQLINVPRGDVRINGEFKWDSSKVKIGYASDGLTLTGVIMGAKIYVGDKLDIKTNASIRAYGTVLRLRPYDSKIVTSFEIMNGAKCSLFSVENQGIFANNESNTNDIIFSARGEGTELHIETTSNDAASHGGAICLCGGKQMGERTSYTEVVDGAKVVCSALMDGSGKESTSAFVNQVYRGLFRVKGKGSLLELRQEKETNTIQAAFRFRLVGEQRFELTEGGELKVTKVQGKTAAVRLYGSDNSFYVASGGKVTIEKMGNEAPVTAVGKASNGQQAIQYVADTGGTSHFVVEGKESDVTLKSSNGAALDCQYGTFDVDLKDQAVFRAEGNTKAPSSGEDKNGIVNANSKPLKFKLDNPLYYDFRNNRPNGGAVFTAKSEKSTFISNDATVSVWKKKPGVNFEKMADNFWAKMNYELGGENLTKVVRANPNNGFSSSFVGAHLYTRISGDTFKPTVDDLCITTNTDKWINGHVSIKNIVTGEIRDAWPNEVWVKLNIKKALAPEDNPGVETDWLPTKAQSAISTVWQYDGKRDGMFIYNNIDEKSDNLLSAGDTVKVVAAYRGAKDAESIHRIDVLPEDLVNKKVKAMDVTPPEKLKCKQTQITDMMTQLSGTIDLQDRKDEKEKEHVFVFLQKLDGQYIVDKNGKNLYTEVKLSDGDKTSTEKNWTIDIPDYIEEKDVTASDGRIGLLVSAKDDVDIKKVDLQPEFPKFKFPQYNYMEPNNVWGNSTMSPDSNANDLKYHGVNIGKSVKLNFKSVLPSTPRVSITVPGAFDKKEGKPLIPLGHPFYYSIQVKSVDAKNSGKVDIQNCRVVVSISERLKYLDFSKLEEDEDIDSISRDGAGNLKVAFNKPLQAGGQFSFLLVAQFPKETTEVDKELETQVVLSADATRPNKDTDFLNHDKITVIPVVESETSGGKSVYLSVVNKRLNIFYSEVDGFDVSLDGKFYKHFTVQNHSTLDSKVLDVPINEIRNKVTVKYVDKHGANKIATWNSNKWSFVD